MVLYDADGNEISVGGSESRLSNLKLGVLGDSITAGIGASAGHGYAHLLANDFKSVNRYGVSSTRIAGEEAQSFVHRYANMVNGLDVVIVYGGTNDYVKNTPLGDEDSTDISTFNGALNTLIPGLLTKYVGSEVIFITPMRHSYLHQYTDNPNAAGCTMEDYRQAILKKCEFHAVPVLDLYAESGMDSIHNASHREMFSSDGVHPNDAGHQRIHDRIVHFCNALFG